MDIFGSTGTLASSTGLASGLDTAGIISKLMAVESQPLTAISNKLSAYQNKVSAYGTLISSLSSLRDQSTALAATDIYGMTASSSDTATISVSATSSASAGTYGITVNQMAKAQSIYSADFASTTSAVADLSVNPIQQLQIQVGSAAPVTITIDSTNNTLQGISDAINAAGAGVSSSIVNDGTGYRLVLTSSSTGAANKITVKVDENNNGVFEEAPAETDTAGLSALAFDATYDASGNVTGGIASMTQAQAAADANLAINGLPVTRTTNTISDLVSGVTLTLNKEGSSATVSVTKDTAGLEAQINGFINQYNSVMNGLRNQIGTKDNQGVLYGDTTSTDMLNNLFDLTGQTFAGKTLAELGITHDQNGKLVFDTTTFENALSSDQQGTVSAINSMGSSLESTLTDYINTTLPDIENVDNETIATLQQEQTDEQARLDKIQASYQAKFTAMEQTIAQLQNQSLYMSIQLGKTSSNGSSSTSG
ncbi:MAG: flagellar filament capping protein FliD [Nitrospiraceae bacterium]|nr:flagellar filament capping protein FliD [Nitrospiraceae bacterium]